MAKKKFDFETGVQRLQEITEQLESDETTLADSVGLYEEGVELLKACTAELKTAELKITELRKKSEGIFELNDTNE